MISFLEHSIRHAADDFGFEIARIGRGVAMRFVTRAFLAVRVCHGGQGRSWDAGGISRAVFFL